MNLIALPIKDAFIIEFPKHHDARGFLHEAFNICNYPKEVTRYFPIKQNTIAKSHKHVIRGIHVSDYAKLLTCVSGSLYDVVVDLRQDSPTYLKWAAVTLTEDNCRQLLVPPNCGHGYYSQQNNTLIVYAQGGCFNPHIAPSVNGDITPFDPLVNVYWPVPTGVEPILSDKDRCAPRLVPSSSVPGTIKCNRKRVLVVGASGQVGSVLMRAFQQHSDQYVVMGTCNEHPRECLMPFDMEKAAKDISYCEALVTTCRPSVICIAAAFTWVDGNDKFPEKAEAVNTKAVENLSKVATSIDAKIIFYSTDHVFDGEGPVSGNTNVRQPCSEEDQTGPVNLYGQLKERAEQCALKYNPQATILRISRVFGPDSARKNFVYQVVRNLQQGTNFRCLANEVSCPTYSQDVAKVTRLVVEHDLRGIYHCAGPDVITKYEWAVQIAKYFQLDVSLLAKVNDLQMPGCSKRPQFVPMATEKIRNALPGFQFHSVQEAMVVWKTHLRDWPM